MTKPSLALTLTNLCLGTLAMSQTAPSIAIENPSFEADVIPRDGNTGTVANQSDDFNTDIVPAGWSPFDDGRNEATAGDNRGIVSHAPDSFFVGSLAETPDEDANDQSFFSAQRDIYQVLTATLAANTTYTLLVDIGDRAGGGAAGAFGDPVVWLGWGDDPDDRSTLLDPDTTDHPATVDGDWVTWTQIYVTGPEPDGLGEPLRIELTTRTNVGWFDNVRLVIGDLDDADALGLEVTSNGSDLDFSWNSQAGKVYDLLTSVNPETDGDPAGWAVFEGQEGIAPTPPSNTLTLQRPADPTRFFVVRERDLFFDDFESDQGWTVGSNPGDAANTTWARGVPTVDPTGLGNPPSSGAGVSPSCFGTNIAGDYGNSTDIFLRSPAINLSSSGPTSARLTLQQYLDTESIDNLDDGDFGTIRVLRADDQSPLGAVVAADLRGIDTDWNEYTALLPPEALGEIVILEFHFVSDNNDNNFAGWYIDDVQVEFE